MLRKNEYIEFNADTKDIKEALDKGIKTAGGLSHELKK
jgi:hypothetical protein